MQLSITINEISRNTSPPCKKTLQKIVYLVEEGGIDLGCKFGIHFYGPYSADLDYAVHTLDMEGILNISYSGMEHNISLCEGVKDYYSNENINKIIAEYVGDSPSELELIATALYVYRKSDNNKAAILEGVKKIKGNKYSIERNYSCYPKINKDRTYCSLKTANQCEYAFYRCIYEKTIKTKKHGAPQHRVFF